MFKWGDTSLRDCEAMIPNAPHIFFPATAGRRRKGRKPAVPQEGGAERLDKQNNFSFFL